MGRETIKALLINFEDAAVGIRECRECSNALKYEISGVLKSAFAVFYFMHESLPEFSHEMQKITSKQPANPAWDEGNTKHNADQKCGR